LIQEGLQEISENDGHPGFKQPDGLLHENTIDQLIKTVLAIVNVLDIPLGCLSRLGTLPNSPHRDRAELGENVAHSQVGIRRRHR